MYVALSSGNIFSLHFVMFSTYGGGIWTACTRKLQFTGWNDTGEWAAKWNCKWQRMPHYKRIQYEIFSAPQNRLYSILFYTLLATTEDIAKCRENPERCATSRLKAVGETRYFNTGKAQSTNLKAQITKFLTASFINTVSSSLQLSARRKALKVFAQLSSRKTRAVSKPS